MKWLTLKKTVLCRLFETPQSEEQIWLNPIQACKTNQSINPNVLQRPEQFWKNCNIIFLSGLQIPIQACKVAQSISPYVL